MSASTATARPLTEARAVSIREGDGIVWPTDRLVLRDGHDAAVGTVKLTAVDGTTRTVATTYMVTVAYRKEDAPAARETTTRMAAVVVPTPVDRDTVLRRIAREHRVDGDGVVLAAIAAAYDAGKAAAR